MIELDKSLRYAAGKAMGDIPLVRESLLWVKEHPKNMQARVDKFSDATADISELVVLGGKGIKGKRGLSSLKRAYRKAGYGEPNRLWDLVASYSHSQEDRYEGWEDTVKELDGAVDAVRDNLTSGAWKFHPEVFAHPPTFLTRLLIEGHALELARFYEQPRVFETYKTALGEVLNEKPFWGSHLEEDFSYWTLLEQEDSKSIVTLDQYIANRNAEPQTDPLTKTAKKVNGHFREGGDAGGVIDQIRQFPRPIAVDFNNVIANNDHPLQMNPDAPQFLEDLQKIGNVFIVTHADSWAHVQRFFVTNNIWNPGMVLMTYRTYDFLKYSHELSRASQLRLEFNLLAQQHFGREFSEDELRYTGGKRVAPIFNKPWEIPIIDDSGITTDGNPGMLGIQVKNWEPGQSEPEDIYNRDLPSLSKAVEIVREHYSKIA